MCSHTKIPTYSIYIHPQNVKRLKSDVWSEDPVPAALTVNKKQYLIDIMYRGSHIREFPKKSYDISFRKPKFFFGETNVHLNAEYMDPSIIRNKLSLDFFHDIGVLSPKAKHISLVINGTYNGVYLQLESVDEHFLTRHGLPKGAIYYAINDNANFSLVSPLDQDVKQSLDSGYERKIGREDDDRKLCDLIYKINTIEQKEFEAEIAKLINIENYLRWLAGVVCTQNFDGFIHNYALYMNGETGLTEIIPWDYDATWGRDIHGDVMPHDDVPITGYNTLTARILNVHSFRKLYREILGEILLEQFTVPFLKPKIERLHRLLRPYVLRDPYIKKKKEQYDEEPNRIIAYISKRNEYLKCHLNDLT